MQSGWSPRVTTSLAGLYLEGFCSPGLSTAGRLKIQSPREMGRAKVGRQADLDLNPRYTLMGSAAFNNFNAPCSCRGLTPTMACGDEDCGCPPPSQARRVSELERWPSSSAWKDGCGRKQSPLVTATHSCAGCLLTLAVPLALPNSRSHQHLSCVRTCPSTGRRRLEVPNSQLVPDSKAKTLSKPGEWGFRLITTPGSTEAEKPGVTEAHSLEYAAITFCHLPQPSYL